MNQARRLADVNSLRPCCDCDLKYICGGGCRVDRFKQLTRVENLFNITETPTRILYKNVQTSYAKWH